MSTGVTILWWPEEGTRLLRLRDEHVPRLVVIKGNVLPPFPLDWSEEEWLRSPFPPEQLDRSLAQLAARIERQPPPPEMRTGDVLTFGDQSVGLSAREAVLASVLATAFNQVVPYAALYAAVGLHPSDDENAFLGLISRLRRHLDPLGLEIHALRCTGYVMQTAAKRKVLSSR
jgi:DNA-binding response OmpR family regulator